eukprot:480918_1
MAMASNESNPKMDNDTKDDTDTDPQDDTLQKFFDEMLKVAPNAKVKFPTLAQPKNFLLGFAYSIAEAESGQIHLTSIRKDRNISVIELKQNGDYKHLKVPDPYRDCNKLYMAPTIFTGVDLSANPC